MPSSTKFSWPSAGMNFQSYAPSRSVSCRNPNPFDHPFANVSGRVLFDPNPFRLRPPHPYDELTDPARVRVAVRIHRHPPRVVVIVTTEHDVGVRGGQEVPERLRTEPFIVLGPAGVLVVKPVPPRMMPIRERAQGVARCQIVLQPLVPRVAGAASRRRGTDRGVERHEVPAAEVVGVVAIGFLSDASEVAVVAGGAGRAVVMVARHRLRDRQERAEVAVVVVHEVRVFPGLVLDVTQREEAVVVTSCDRGGDVVVLATWRLFFGWSFAGDVADGRDADPLRRRRCGDGCERGNDDCDGATRTATGFRDTSPSQDPERRTLAAAGGTGQSAGRLESSPLDQPRQSSTIAANRHAAAAIVALCQIS